MSENIKILPSHLINRYKYWKATEFEENKVWYTKITTKGQNPKTMVISCCDSRIHVTSMFGADKGEFFIHRNIANLIPPYNPDGDHHGTSAALEYAIVKLHIPNIIILGHSNCGGITSAYNLCNNNKNSDSSVFVNKWLNILKPAYENISKTNLQSDKEGIKKLEKESIKISLKNLNNFPFINNALKENKLALHGLWYDIASGSLEMLDPNLMEFIKV